MHLPNLLVLGPPKCGTSTLYSICELHPDVCVSTFKEPTFFSDENNFKKGLEWYSDKYFSQCSSQKVLAEFTPAYFTSAVALKNIQSSLGPETKFIIVLRNPAERSFSEYLHYRRAGLVSLPFNVLIRQLAESFSKGEDLSDKYSTIYTTSLYDAHFAKFFEYFPDRSKVLVLKFEDDIAGDCAGFKEKLSDFMGLDLTKFSPGVEIQNSASDVRDFIRPLKKFLNSDNLLKKTLRRIFPASLRYEVSVSLNKFLDRKFIKPSMKPNRDELRLINKEIFSDSITNTEKILNMELSDYYRN